jgi:flagellin
VSGVNGATAQDDFVINSSLGSFDVYYKAGASAADIAREVNATGSGVRATALTELVLGDLDALGGTAGGGGFAQATTYSFNISTDYSGSGEDPKYTNITFRTGGTDDTAVVNSTDMLNTAVQAFNDQSSVTGFTAEVVKTESGNYGLKLYNQNGDDLRIMNDSASGADILVSDISVLDGDGTNTTDSLDHTLVAADNSGTWAHGDGTWFTGRVLFDSDKAFSVTTAVDDVFQDAATPGTAAAGTYGAVLQAVEKMDVSTREAAERTLSLVDSALSALSNQRGRYGALQTRFENAMSNLQTASENTSAARSRIRDTDFAAETAELTRNQILQQAGTAMLAQANQSGQNVLSLLQ